MIDEVEEKEDEGSLRETIVAAFKGDDTDDTATPSAERTGSDNDVPKETASEDVGDKTPKAADPTQPKAEQEAKPIDPPARWTKEEKEEFAALDPKVQKLLLGRNKGLEADYTRKMGEIAQERQRFHQLEQVLSPRRETWQRQGMNDAQFINSVMSYWDLAQRDPMAFIDQFSRERGIDLAALYTPTAEQLAQYFGHAQAEGGPDGRSQESLPPAVANQLRQLAQEQEQLRNVVLQQHQTLAQRQQQEHQAIQKAATDEVSQFSGETDEHGNPLRPFFQDVRQDMIKLMQAGIAGTLQDAYDRAVYMRPDVRSKIEENREIARRREEQRRRQEEAAKAKRAGSSISSSSSSYSPSPSGDDDESNLSLRQIIEKQFNKARVGDRI